MQCISSRLEEIELNSSRGYDYPQDYDFWIWYIIGGLLLLVAASSFLNTVLFLVKAKSVQGTVIEVVPIPKRETTKRRFEFIPHSGFSLTDYNEDERITVFYDPENPENAKIGDFEELFLYGTIFFLLGAFSCLCGFLQIRSRHKIRRREEM
jgi:hypothetical protein